MDSTQQQQQAEIEANAGAPSPSGASFGSIGPFLAVISVLSVLAIASCFLGRICGRRRRTVAMVTPLDSIKYRGCLGWVRRKFGQCLVGEVEAGAKVMACGEERNDNETPKESSEV